MLIELGSVTVDEMLVEVQFIAYFMAVLLGVQLGVYFFYQYARMRDTTMKLNRILLSNGAFTIMVILGAFLIVIARIFKLESSNPVLFDALYRAGFASTCASPVVFLAFLAIEELKPLMNVTVMRIAMVLSMAPVVLVLLLGWESPVFRISLAGTAFNGIFMIRFQVLLIRASRGEIRRRTIMFLCGELLALSALFFATNVSMEIIPFSIFPRIASFFTAVALLIAGLLLILVSAYEFPPFYEFELERHLLKFFVIEQSRNMILFHEDFRIGGGKGKDRGKEMPLGGHLGKHVDPRVENENGNGTSKDENANGKWGEDGDLERHAARDDLYSGAITGIDELLGAITGLEDDHVDTIRRQDTVILLERGSGPSEALLYALVLDKELKSARYYLHSLREQFEAYYSRILNRIDLLFVDQFFPRVFDDFSKEIKAIR